MMELRKVDASNLWELLDLRVAPHQEHFVASNTHSILEAYACNASGGTALPFGIYADGTPVGFLMIGFGCADWPDAPEVARGSYSLWRFMIDRRYQGRGYGTQALELALEYIRTCPAGKSGRCWLSYEPDNETARRLYHRFGFRETNEKDGDELIAVLEL